MRALSSLLAIMLVSLSSAAAHANPVQAAIDDAVARGENSVAIPPGEYRLDAPLSLRKLSGFTLNAEGARFVFTELQNGGIAVSDCERLTLRGFTIDFDPLPFTQGAITAIDLKSLRVSFRIHEGYPDFTEAFYRARAPHAFAFSAATHEWLTDAPDLYAESVKKLTPRTAELSFGPSHRGRLEALSVGDHIVFGARGGRGIRIDGASDFRIEGVTFHSAPGIAVTARYMDGKNVFSYRIARGPTPPGASVPRLISTSADGLNYAYARTGPIIENCDFSWMGDDSVNIHGIAFYVADTSDDGRTVNVLRPYGTEAFGRVIRPGDQILALDQGSFGVTGEARIKAFSSAPEIDAAHLATARKVWPWITGRVTLYSISTDASLNLKPGDFVEIPAISGAGYTIRNNRFGHHRGRGLRLMAGQGLVEDNLIEHVSQAGITLGPEMVLFREAGWVSDVIVRGNTLRQVGFDPKMFEKSSWIPGAISVVYRGATPGAPRPDTRHERIDILNNIIEDVGVAAIHLNQVADSRVAGNRIARVNLRPSPSAGFDYGLSIDGAICVQHSSRIGVKNNQVDERAASLDSVSGRLLRVDARDPSAIPLQKAGDTANPGDIIYIEPGSGPYREPLFVRRSGTREAPILIEGNGNEITGFEPLVFQRQEDGFFRVEIPRNPDDVGDTAFVLRHRGRRLMIDANTGRFVTVSGFSPVEWDPSSRRLTLTDTTRGAEQDWEISTRYFAVRIQDVSHHHYRDIVATGATNDGFSLHGAGEGLVFENIVGAQNLDEGFSAHAQIQCEIRSGRFYENDNGIFNVGESRLRAGDILVRDNLGIGIGVSQNAVIELTDALLRGNGMRQLSVRRDARAVLHSGVEVHLPATDRRRWLSYKESRSWTKFLAVETQPQASLGGSPRFSPELGSIQP